MQLAPACDGLGLARVERCERYRINGCPHRESLRTTAGLQAYAAGQVLRVVKPSKFAEMTLLIVLVALEGALLGAALVALSDWRYRRRRRANGPAP